VIIPLYLGVGLSAVALLGAHALADYPWQGPYLALGKNRYAEQKHPEWWHLMAAHCAIHAALAALVLGVWWVALFEFGFHWLTDNSKCAGKITYNEDQFIHVFCKATWLWLVWWLYGA
jgi:hypothetical protein